MLPLDPSIQSQSCRKKPVLVRPVTILIRSAFTLYNHRAYFRHAFLQLTAFASNASIALRCAPTSYVTGLKSLRIFSAWLTTDWFLSVPL